MRRSLASCFFVLRTAFEGASSAFFTPSSCAKAAELHVSLHRNHTNLQPFHLCAHHRPIARALPNSRSTVAQVGGNRWPPFSSGPHAQSPARASCSAFRPAACLYAISAQVPLSQSQGLTEPPAPPVLSSFLLPCLLCSSDTTLDETQYAATVSTESTAPHAHAVCATTRGNVHKAEADRKGRERKGQYLLSEDKLNVARARHVRVDAAVRTVRPAATVASLVHL